MGVILDTSVLVSAERRGLNAAQMLAQLHFSQSEQIGISTITLMEFAHGIARASSDAYRAVRMQFAEDVQALITVIAFGPELAMKTGVLNGELQQQGTVLGILDLMIGVTALAGGHSVATGNVRHFRRIPGLAVIEV